MSKAIKICGLSRPCDIEAVNEYKPEYCGFIINFPKSHRNISVDTLKELVKGLSPEVKPVGVFVDQPAELIAELLNDGVISVAQLHGKEDNEYIAKLRSLCGPVNKTIWKAFQIKTEADVEAANNSAACFVILDAGQGAGVTFNWELLAGINREYGLAGGLKAENIPEALTTKACLLDVSGGVETDKLKDPIKIKELIGMVRA